MADGVGFKIVTSAWQKSMDDWERRVEAATVAALQKASELAAREAQASFGTEGAPKTRSGRLAASIAPTAAVKGMGGYVQQLGPQGVEYARRVELGKKGRRSAAPHPYLQPGFARATAKFRDVFEMAWAETQPKGR